MSVVLRRACLVSASAAFALATLHQQHRPSRRPRRRNMSSSPSTARSTIEQWQRSRALAARTGATLHLFPVLRFPAVARAHARTTGAGPKARQIQCRLRRVEARTSPPGCSRSGSRMREGHDIASHACGHFDGANWSQADWHARIHELPLDPRERLCDQRHRRRAGRAGGSSPTTTIKGFRAPYLVDRQARSTRRSREPASPMTPAAFRADRPAGSSTAASCASRCRRSPKARRRGASSPWTTICSCAIPAASSARTRMRSSRTAPSTRSRPPSTRSTRASARRCSSASISR